MKGARVKLGLTSAASVVALLVAGCGSGSSKSAASTATNTSPASTTAGAPSGSVANGGSGVVTEATLAQALLELLAVSHRHSPQVQPAPVPPPAPGDRGYYACTKLAVGDFAKTVGQPGSARPNGGAPANGSQPSYSDCHYETAARNPATGFQLDLTVAHYPRAAVAKTALYQHYGDTPQANIPGVGDGAFIFSNGTPAYVLVGSDVTQLDLTVPGGADRSNLYVTLMRAIAGHANNPAPTPTPPTPGRDDLDPCLVTPAEMQTIFHSGPVKFFRQFANLPTDLACVYQLPGPQPRDLTVDTVTAAALATVGQTVRQRYASDRKANTDVSDIPGFPLPTTTVSSTSKFADLWGFGNAGFVEMVDNGPVQGPGGSATGRPAPQSSLVNFPDPIPDLYLAHRAPDANVSTSSPGSGEGLNQ